MSLESTSVARARAVEMSGDPRALEGPLRGYHHETYVFPLPTADGSTIRWKCREPRSSLLWFDRRCFVSEEQLLKALAGRITHIPEILEAGDAGLQRFIEGETLGSLYGSGKAIPGVILQQIVVLFRQLAGVAPDSLAVGRRCAEEDRPDDGDTNGFLERLVLFTEKRVYERNLPMFADLFGELGINARSFPHLRDCLSGLKRRPFCLLHADLHRENFIIDSRRRLWTIDWELAMVGDPLYDLATHLHLMRYPYWQRGQMVKRWCAAVEGIRPGGSNGLDHDLPRLIAYKRAQSVFTDVIREAMSLGAVSEGDDRLDRAGRNLQKILIAAAGSLRLDSVPAPGEIAMALLRWRKRYLALTAVE
ncbi:phosphotransferase [Streptomyces sp. NPDC000987]|uniref:phosphotransferase n=1 Tax=Streptomyces sp. NPDC000987 TaxID=3154374 RepID=UPI00332AE00E